MFSLAIVLSKNVHFGHSISILLHVLRIKVVTFENSKAKMNKVESTLTNKRTL